MSCHYHCIPLLSPVPRLLSVPLPILTEQERAVLLIVWSCTCSDGGAPAAAEHYFVAAVVYLAFPSGRSGLVFVSPTSLLPSRQLEDLSSLSHLTCNG